MQCSSESAYFDWNNDPLNGNPSQSSTVVKSQSGEWISLILVPAALDRWRARADHLIQQFRPRGTEHKMTDSASSEDVFPNQMIDQSVSSVKFVVHAVAAVVNRWRWRFVKKRISASGCLYSGRNECQSDEV